MTAPIPTDCGVICFGCVKSTDTHLALAIHHVNKEIIGWLEPAANSISNCLVTSSVGRWRCNDTSRSSAFWRS